MSTSQNGWPVLASDQIRRWVVPIEPLRPLNRRAVILPAVPGAGGFLLTHLALWFHERIEPLNDPDNHPADDWGWAPRPIRGSTSISNHASGTAIDVNATRHPMGVPTADTFTRDQIDAIHHRLGHYSNLIRWGGDYSTRPDGMHFELNASRDRVVVLAASLMDSPRGVRVRAANPVLD